MVERRPLDFSGGIWGQLQKARIDKDGTFRAPVKANGKDGIVFGEPPLFPDMTAPTPRRATSRWRTWARRLRRSRDAS